MRKEVRHSRHPLVRGIAVDTNPVDELAAHEEERFPGGAGYMFNAVPANSDVPTAIR